tara:strand:- start:1790 stop:2206 length:417 start_codon:yes stop_codon:yes gene_type:complete
VLFLHKSFVIFVKEELKMSISIQNPYALFSENSVKLDKNLAADSAQLAPEIQGDKVDQVGSSKSERSEAVQAFLDYMSKTPAERMEDAWLAEKGITKEDFENMSPEEKQATLEEMRADIKRKLEEGLEPPQKRLSIFV